MKARLIHQCLLIYHHPDGEQHNFLLEQDIAHIEMVSARFNLRRSTEQALRSILDQLAWNHGLEVDPERVQIRWRVVTL